MDKSEQVDSDPVIPETQAVRKPVRSGYEGLTSGVNDQVMQTGSRGLRDPSISWRAGVEGKRAPQPGHWVRSLLNHLA